MATIEQIGWYIQPTPREYTNSYETAAWWQAVLVPAGRYPLAGEIEGSQVRHVHVSRLNGTITGDYFSSLYGTTPMDKDKGKPGTVHGVGMYGYNVADCIANSGGVNNLGCTYVLDPGWRITALRWYNDSNWKATGGWRWMYSIVRDTRTYTDGPVIEHSRRIRVELVAPSEYSRDGYSGGYRDSEDPDKLHWRVVCGHCEHITIVHPNNLYPRDTMPKCELCHNGPINEQFAVRYGHTKLAKMHESIGADTCTSAKARLDSV